MNSTKRGKRIRETVIYCVIAALLIPALLAYSVIVNNELRSYITQALDEVSDHNVKSINLKIDTDLQLVNEISERVIKTHSASTPLIENLKAISAEYGFKRMGIVDREGVSYSTDGAALDIYYEDHIVRSFEGETVISDVFPDAVDGKPIFVYSSPLTNNDGKIVGVLFATCDTEEFRMHLSETAFNEKGYSYIVKSDGSTVLDSANETSFKNMTNVFDSMRKSGDNEAVIEKMSLDMSAGNSGVIIFVNTGVRKYMNYAPLGINDWYMLSVVPTNVMEATRDRLMLITYVVQAFIIIIAVLLVTVLIRSEKQQHAKLEHILYDDELTGGMTYAKFCQDAPELIEKHPKNSACVMVDLDNFRLINNLYGHAEGNNTILRTYRVLKRTIGANDLLSRRVADRFYILVIFKDKKELDEKLETFISELRSSCDENKTEYILNPSIGVYIIEDPHEQIDNITNNATLAHDTINRNTERIAFYNEEQHERLIRNKLLEDQMEHAHKNHEFIPYLQPKYSAQTGKICGAEALIRWKNPDGSITMPGKFIPLAESNGFIRVLDRDMFDSVCCLQRRIIDSGRKAVPISVNVSRQLMYETDFASDYIEMIKKYDLPTDLIELEITESVLFDDFDGFRTVIDTLRDGGFRILMDDFGTGYSSLMMLSSVPIDNLKLDKSFIDRFEEEKGRQIINCVIELAKSLSLPLTAEGVETQGQFVYLKNMGCDVIQGYYFSKPVPQEEYINMLEFVKADDGKEN